MQRPEYNPDTAAASRQPLLLQHTLICTATATKVATQKFHVLLHTKHTDTLCTKWHRRCHMNTVSFEHTSLSNTPQVQYGLSPSTPAELRLLAHAASSSTAGVILAGQLAHQDIGKAARMMHVHAQYGCWHAAEQHSCQSTSHGWSTLTCPARHSTAQHG